MRVSLESPEESFRSAGFAARDMKVRKTVRSRLHFCKSNIEWEEGNQRQQQRQQQPSRREAGIFGRIVGSMFIDSSITPSAGN
jgi:hypothetical protein